MRHPSICSRASEWALVAVIALLAGCSEASEESSSGETATVTRDDLVITVVEGGDLVSANPTLIRSQVEGRNTIIELIPEGTRVRKGMVLARIDSSGIEDKLNRQEIELERARDNLTQAEQAVEIQEKKNLEDLGRAQSQLELAQNAKIAYVEGTYPLKKAEFLSQRILAEEKLERAKDEAQASAKLYKDQFISLNELKADQLKHNQAKEELELVKKREHQLEAFTKPEELRNLQSEIELKTLAKERVAQQAASEMAQKQNTLTARKRNFKLEQERRDKLKAQLAQCELSAPRDGLVVYGRQDRGRRGSEPMAVGKDVREREEILRMPDLTNMIVDVDIHESSVKKVRPGLKCLVRLDALPNRHLIGTVTYVAPVPSSQSSWLNPDLKVYQTKVTLDEVPEGLKPGMRAKAEIVVDTLKNQLQVPMQAVRSSGARSFVYVKTDGDPELREVKLGANNERMVAVNDGLSEGEEIFLMKPDNAPDLPAPAPAKRPEVGPAVPASSIAGAGGGKGPAGGAGQGKGGRRGRMSKEQREKWMKMSPEERKKLMEKFRSRRQDPARDD